MWPTIVSGGSDTIPAPSKDDDDELVAVAVAHEVSNALSAILGWVGLAHEEPETRDEALALIEASARTAEAALSQLRWRDGAEAIETLGPVSLNQLLAHVERLAQAECRLRGATLTCRLQDSLWVHAPTGSLFGVFWNLVKNALESQTGVHVELRAESHDGRIHIVVTDDGPGMTEGQRAECFRPGFTTKSGGRGIGLFVVARTVRASRGTIRVEPNTPRGTRFVVELTAAQPPIEAAAPPRGVTVLVVDNDTPVRELMTASLRLRGYDVTAVTDAQGARSVTGRFDIALIDLNLGDSRGDDLARELHTAGRVGRVALVSGMELPDDLSTTPDQWLRKPFDLESLARVVESLAPPDPQTP